jgi:hypothetical protein
MVGGGEVIDSALYLEPVAIDARHLVAWGIQPTAAKFGYKLGAVAAPDDMVEAFARSRTHA